ncbi:MAG: OmpA family protein, partial [Nitrospirales bacterium]
VVYVDWGRRDGLQVGDRLEVYHPLLGLPPQLIGEIRVLALEEETATALVAKSRTTINRGDRVVFKERGEPPPVVREPREVPKPIEEARLTPPEEIPPKRPIDIQEVKDELQEELDRLVNLLHYESGQFTVKPESLPVLNQIGELLKSVEDRHIRIEGHTDNVEIGPKLKPLFPSNQELSEARATHVLRYLTQVGGLSPENLSAIGFADTKPLAENTEEAGRSKNRRVHIKLIPKDAMPSEGPEVSGAPTTAPEPEPAPPDASMTPGQLSPMGNPQSSSAPGSPDQPASEQPAMDGGTGAEEPIVPQTTTSTVP